MRKRKFEKTIIYLMFTILLFAGFFLCFDKNVNASGYYKTMDSENFNKWVSYYREYEEQKKETEGQNGSGQQSGSQKESKKKPGSLISAPAMFLVIVVLGWLFRLYLKNLSSGSYTVDIDSSSDDTYHYKPSNTVNKIQNTKKEPESPELTTESELTAESELYEVSLEPEEYEISLEPEEFDVSLEPEEYEVSLEPEEYDVSLEPEQIGSTIENNLSEVTTESEQHKAVTESVQHKAVIEPVQPAEMTEHEPTKAEDETIKELSSRELKEIVKNLDPIDKNKFMELAKNGKKDEAIKICNDVIGLGYKNAEKIIDLKLYY